MSIKPTAKDFRAEVVCHFKLFICNDSNKTHAPQPKQWTTGKLEEYLKNHPITDESDVQYLCERVLEQKLLVEDAQLSFECNNNLLQKSGMGSSLTKLDLDNHQMSVDNRNSIDKWSTTVSEMVSNHLNDPKFNPGNEVLATIHSTFSVEIVVGFENIADLLCTIPEKFESRFNSMVLDQK